MPTEPEPCQTCRNTGQVWTVEEDGSGAWDMACPDCDTPYPGVAAAEEYSRILRKSDYLAVAPVETGEPWYGPAQADWDDSR
jgi:hypothetical protein